MSGNHTYHPILTDEEHRRAQQAVKQVWEEGAVDITLGAMEWFSVVANVQLALRHPDNKSASAEAARRAAKVIAKALAALVPDAGWLLDLGWDPRYDTERRLG